MTVQSDSLPGGAGPACLGSLSASPRGRHKALQRASPAPLHPKATTDAPVRGRVGRRGRGGRRLRQERARPELVAPGVGRGARLLERKRCPPPCSSPGAGGGRRRPATPRPPPPPSSRGRTRSERWTRWSLPSRGEQIARSSSTTRTRRPQMQPRCSSGSRAVAPGPSTWWCSAARPGGRARLQRAVTSPSTARTSAFGGRDARGLSARVQVDVPTDAVERCMR